MGWENDQGHESSEEEVTVASKAARLVDGLPESDPPGVARLAEHLSLCGGYGLRVQRPSAGLARQDRLTLQAPNGQLLLSLELSPEGVRMSVSGTSLSLHALDEVDIQCSRFRVQARERVELASAGEVSVEAAGAIRSTGLTQELRATLGDVQVVANDDVRVDGERIRLNSPEPLQRARPAAFARWSAMQPRAGADADGCPADGLDE